MRGDQPPHAPQGGIPSVLRAKGLFDCPLDQPCPETALHLARAQSPLAGVLGMKGELRCRPVSPCLPVSSAPHHARVSGFLP